MKCEFCKISFEEDKLDLVTVDDGENVWLCHDCEEGVKNDR